MKKLLLFLLIGVSVLLLVMHNQWRQRQTIGSQEPRHKMPRIIEGLNTQTWVSKESFRRTPLKMSDTDTKYFTATVKTFPNTSISMTRIPMSLTRRGAMDPNDLKIPEESQRPWYMTGGQLYPKNSVINTTTGRRNILIFPDELPGEDRIPGRAGLASLIHEKEKQPTLSVSSIFQTN
jgi:hypothetical protein